MKEMEINNKNYFSKENELKYMGSTQIKSFLKCEKETLAKLNGEFEEEKSKAMLVSSYIDSVISNELEDFKEENPEIFTKNGELKAEYKLADSVIEQMKNDPMFMKYISGEPQVIMTGEISGVPIKIKIDSYHKDKCIVDLKCMANLDLIWNEEAKQKENFINSYDYVLQGALYQEIVRQNTGKQLPFIIAVATKEKYSQRALLQIPQESMDSKIEFLKQYLPHIQAVKNKEIEPTSCGKCDYCKSLKKCDGVYYYDEYFKEGE